MMMMICENIFMISILNGPELIFSGQMVLSISSTNNSIYY